MEGVDESVGSNAAGPGPLKLDSAVSVAPVEALREAFRTALAVDPAGAERLGYAQTSVRFEDPDSGEGVTLLLDRDVPVVTDGPEPAEVAVLLASDAMMQMSVGGLLLPALVARRDIETRGPVRRYLEVDPILRSMLGRIVGHDRPEATAPSRPRWEGSITPDLLALETRDLHKAFGSQKVLQGMDMKVPEGVISVILGPSGTGKSVLLQHILGLLKPDAGEVLVRGRALSRMSRSEQLALRTEIGVMFQDGALFSAMNVYDNVAFPLRQHTDLSEREVRDAVLPRLDAVGLRASADVMPSGLSGGMKKRAGLARALVMEPSMMLVDEPDSGLDPVRTALLGELLVEQHAETGGTMIVVTHNIELAKTIAEHLSVVWQGQVLESGFRDDIMTSEKPFVQQFLNGATIGPLGMDA